MSKAIAIKFNSGSKVHYMVPPKQQVNECDQVIVTTIRGKEIATVFAKDCDVTPEELSQFVLEFDRLASENDLQKDQENKDKVKCTLETTQEIIDQLKLDMHLVDAEYTIDGQKVIISFVCDDRVDFRELVKQLANNLKLRIELKQIGTRDQAKIVGGIGSCGQECCCIRYLNDFDKVSVKMAKTQNLSLNPTKISGVCGRLMCCLSYENDYYSEVSNKMPKIGSQIKTPQGMGTVLYNNLLKQKVTVKIEGDDVKICDFELNELNYNRHTPHNEDKPNKPEKEETPKE